MYKPESRFPTQAEPQDTQRQIKIWDQEFWFELYYYCICIAFYYFNNFSFSEYFIYAFLNEFDLSLWYYYK